MQYFKLCSLILFIYFNFSTFVYSISVYSICESLWKYPSGESIIETQKIWIRYMVFVLDYLVQSPECCMS